MNFKHLWSYLSRASNKSNVAKAPLATALLLAASNANADVTPFGVEIESTPPFVSIQPFHQNAPTGQYRYQIVMAKKGPHGQSQSSQSGAFSVTQANYEKQTLSFSQMNLQANDQCEITLIVSKEEANGYSKVFEQAYQCP